MTPVVSSVTLSTGMTLSYAAAGDPTAPVVVLLPGPTDSWRSYASILERLPSSVRAIAVSQRGHGDSAKPLTGYGVHDFASDVPPLLDALGLDSAVLAGHSGSCLVVRQVAIAHPERVAGLILEASPTTLRGHPGLLELVASVVTGLEDPIDASFARSFVADTSSEQVPAEVIDDLAAELMKVPARVWKEMFAGLLAYDDLDEIENISAPALLLWGDDDGLVDRGMQTTLARRIRDSELIVYKGVGHTPRWEDPARFASNVSVFVERVLRPRG